METFYGSASLLTSDNPEKDTPKCAKAVPATLNIYWILGTCLCVWFLWIYSPSLLFAMDYIPPLLYVHLFGVYSIYMACVHNTLLTPSTLGGAARPFHIWVGRYGLILGVFGFVTGFYLTWLTPDVTNPLGFSIGITSGGIAQMVSEFLGYKAIRKYKEIKSTLEASPHMDEAERFQLEDEQDKCLILHIDAMIGLFFLACGIPAMIRLVGTGLWLLLFIILAYVCVVALSKSYADKILDKRRTERM